jgi:hypothetical protein
LNGRSGFGNQAGVRGNGNTGGQGFLRFGSQPQGRGK